MNVGIIGCGKIGRKRSESLGNNKLVAVSDINIENAYSLALENTGVKVFSDHKDLLKEDIDVVIVSTTNNMLASIALDAVNANKHVLIEKPGAIHYTQLDPIISAAEKNNVLVKVGYNLRHHPGISKAIHMSRGGILDEIMFMRATYGHGGRLGYEKEWRADPLISGGGELIDQGSHLIDLSRIILGDLILVSGSVYTYFWDMAVEDNAFIQLVNINGKTSWLQVSCTEWRNKFCLEIYGKKGKIQVEGLGGSYGTEKLTYYKMSSTMEKPEIFQREYLDDDKSFETEFNDFVLRIKNNLKPWKELENARDTLKIIGEIYARKV